MNDINHLYRPYCDQCYIHIFNNGMVDICIKKPLVKISVIKETYLLDVSEYKHCSFVICPDGKSYNHEQIIKLDIQ
jgi:hypothetical protein